MTYISFHFRSCAGREHMGAFPACDVSWLTNTKLNPLAVGQIVNNHTSKDGANVAYQELDLDGNFPTHLLQYIPNINFAPTPTHDTYEDDDACNVAPRRTVLLIATRDIYEGEELLSSYFTEVYSEHYQT